MLRRITLLCSFLVLGLTAHANNVEVTNISLTDQNPGAETSVIQFDLNWENSWRISSGPGNWDAAWVFAKYRVGNGRWMHAQLGTGGSTPSGATVDLKDGKGAFIYRSTDGSGDVSFNDVQLVWDYGVDGVDASAVVDVQVFAIEMVYISEGEYSMGTPFNSADVISEIGKIALRDFSNTVNVPYRVISENSIAVGNTGGGITYENTTTTGNNTGDGLGPIPAAFPKGFNAIYYMKYEASQAQFVAFFNTLTQDQKINMDPTKGGNNISIQGNGFAWPGQSGPGMTKNPNTPFSYVQWRITMAYLDWAALRPITEMEYEKAGRGPQDPIKLEFAHGSPDYTTNEYVYSNLYTPNSLVTNPGVGVGNLAIRETRDTLRAMVRCGIFAASAVNPTREETGGSYYGVMELSGNLYEMIVSIGSPEGRAFTGNHGDGILGVNGSANETGWPQDDAAGGGYRGGSFIDVEDDAWLSDRSNAVANLLPDDRTLLAVGIRGGRSAN
ncbi:SUMF1/EgtB/PvdO family nonheme iron enzyme [Neolewinella antarctica]|uniref:Formylglycine-generating enzyme required for sulfatase activity n=1 Tax=Neolewinella antarctica TaxID=442734 RepID=A0ABX0X9U4_9BACT|nr:SUMF1/EgtB/PvdO family nonheme iron enzyme [Neolewinella antarctica]NJC26006.1 formylglycine-generating enzyme required for sulfatase activity [Neolewinella antarctica]